MRFYIKDKYQQYFLFASRAFALASIFCTILFPTYLKVLLPAMAILALLSGKINEKFAQLKNDPIIISAILLVIIFAIGMIYSEATSSQIFTGFFKYTKILYVIFLLPIFAEYKYRRLAINTLIVAIFLDAVIYYLHSHGIITINQTYYPGGYLRYPISIAAILGYTTFIVANRCVNEKKYRTLNIGLLLTAIYVLFFVFEKRTGQLVFFFMLALTLLQQMGWKGMITTFIIVPLMSGFLFWASPDYYNHVKQGVKEAVSYIKTENADNTSIGDRLAFTQYSFKVIKEHPLFGAGTGSFSTLYKTTGGPPLAPNSMPRDPHNEFVMIAFQVGALGLAFFLIWLFSQWKETKYLPKEDEFLAQGLIVSFIVICFCNSALVVVVSGFFYSLLSGILFAARYNK